MKSNEDFSSEIYFRTSRSSGAGGQNVNKVETRVEALWDVEKSSFFTPEQKQKILLRLKNRIGSSGTLSVASSEARSQLRNKMLAQEKLLSLVGGALTEKKQRKATAPSYGSKLRRLEQKKRHSEKKSERGRRYE